MNALDVALETDAYRIVVALGNDQWLDPYAAEVALARQDIREFLVATVSETERRYCV